MKKYRLITAALPYINNVPHLGHIVGSHLPADIFARYSREKGYEVLFVGGSDENGTPSELAAEKINVPLKKLLDKLYMEHKKSYDWFEISYDIFSRTSKEIHERTVQDFFLTLYKNGFIKEGNMRVFYSSKEKRFLPGRYVLGECPSCGYKQANADQCEKCSTFLSPSLLINPISSVSREKVELKEVKHLFFKLSEVSNDLEKWLKDKKWSPQVLNLARSWIKEGLKDRSITRDLKHGVKVPLEGYKDKVFYVWFDAPIGYLSFTIEAKKNSWENYWKGNSEIYNFLGKDNIPFHTLFWPGMIIAHKNLNLPTRVVGFQYLNYEGKKFSKSKSQGVFCERLPESGIDSELLRAYLVMLLPETNDSEFRWENFRERVNSDLVGNFGNFFNRVFSFLENKLNFEIEKPTEENLREEDRKFLKIIEKKIENISNYFEEVKLRQAFFEVLALSSEGNKYFNDSKPWEKIKDNPEEAKRIIYLSIYLSKVLAICSFPFLPKTSKKIWVALGLGEFETVFKGKGIWDSLKLKIFPEFKNLKRLDLLFKKITEEDLEKYKEIASKTTPLKELLKNE